MQYDRIEQHIVSDEQLGFNNNLLNGLMKFLVWRCSLGFCTSAEQTSVTLSGCASRRLGLPTANLLRSPSSDIALMRNELK